MTSETQNPPTARKLATMMLVTLWLCACAGAPVQQPPADPLLEEAQFASGRGDWNAAARLWEQLASRDPALSSGYRLYAADALWLGGNVEQAQNTLRQVKSKDLDRADSAREALLRGEIALNSGDLQQAEFYLSAAGEGLAGDQRPRLRDSRQRLEAMQKDPAALVLAEVAASLDEMGSWDTASAVRILQQMETVPSTRLQEEALGFSRLADWAALTVAVRKTLLSREDLLEASTNWVDSHSYHPVDGPRYMELAWQYGQFFTPPGRIAVLLPTSGGLAAAGDAIRDGLISAFLDNPASSELRFFDIDDDPNTALSAYQQAEQEGFNWVIGPLRQSSVQRIAARPGNRVPALLLNTPGETSVSLGVEVAEAGAKLPTDAELYNVSLSQQAEAKAVASHMLGLGHKRVILLLADSNWGARAESAFIDEFLAGEGEIMAIERFNAKEADHSSKLTRLLKIEDSRQRRSRLQSLLGLSLEFEDSRRDDFEAIFMAADATLGRQLKPQLRFYDAGTKPVFAMSRVFTGTINTTVDTDLNGVIVPATRWMLENDSRTATKPLNSLRGGAFGALHALGRDAWGVLPWLDMMERDPEFLYPGKIGDLQLGMEGRLERRPVWAVFRGGRPVPVPESKIPGQGQPR